MAREVRGPVGQQRLEIGGEELPITVKAAGARERSMDELQDALIPNLLGSPVRVRDVAAVEQREALGTVGVVAEARRCVGVETPLASAVAG